VANTGSRLLISGPSGVGQGSGRAPAAQLEPARANPFVSVNSARITPERFEEELFGEEPMASCPCGPAGNGRWGHALSRRGGRHAPVDPGAHPACADRAGLLRVGGARQIRVDVRVVSSTSRNLEKEIAEKRFREDLFYRLNVVPVACPAADRAARRHSRAGQPFLRPLRQ
jgi:two-component system nitrogen regulation response regulator NtrX